MHDRVWLFKKHIQAVVNGFQATQSFLRVFGQPGPIPGVFVIGVCNNQSS